MTTTHTDDDHVWTYVQTYPDDHLGTDHISTDQFVCECGAERYYYNYSSE